MPPLSQPSGFSTPANCAACRESIRQGSQSFYMASLMLPVAIREPAYAVYAFCRMADDLIDRDEGGIEGIRILGQMLDRIYRNRPGPHFVERVFADVVERFALPREIPEALIEGLAWDAEGRRYETLEDLVAYAVRVAGTVGFMMTLVMGRREPNVLARACDLGVAMQLTNIARDIGEDAGNGRIYMPLSWLRDGGVDPEGWLAAPRYGPEIQAVVARLLADAELLYDRSLSGVAALPASCRLGINLARLLYREIGREIGRGVDPVKDRAVTSRRQKMRLLAEAAGGRISDLAALPEPAIHSAVSLIAAIAMAPPGRALPAIPPWWNVMGRSEHMIALLMGFSTRAPAAEASGRSSPLVLRPRPDTRSHR
ncbi:phytoene synthase [Rhodoligotrophos appendicifer]|uniref:phytoene/squalene synthase family protein n=1 Tax=Rhodoligotrophos appendicifer TaxID=987056 RepID=UPI00118531F3|nr:phytoene/squalene synthase family protein [Rhodoligotrophos appendicifer]